MSGSAERIRNETAFLTGMPAGTSKGHGIRLVPSDEGDIQDDFTDEEFFSTLDRLNKRYANVLKKLAE